MNMVGNARLLMFAGLGLLLAACSARPERVQQNAGKGSEMQMPTAQNQRANISPGHCRIIGTLVSVDSAREESGPCSKAPCRATIRVDSVLGYGTAFSSPLVVKSQIKVRFAFTVGPTTKDLFPNMADRMPGIQIGDRFQSDIELRTEMGSAEHEPSYLIYAYSVLK